MVNRYDIAHKLLMNEEMKQKNLVNLVDKIEFVNDYECSLFLSFQVIQEVDDQE